MGLLGLIVPGALGTGYGWLTARAMTPGGLDSMALWMIVALPFVKIAATSLTIGSGGSGRHLRARDGDRRVRRSVRVVPGLRSVRCACPARRRS